MLSRSGSRTFFVTVWQICIIIGLTPQAANAMFMVSEGFGHGHVLSVTLSERRCGPQIPRNHPVAGWSDLPQMRRDQSRLRNQEAWRFPLRREGMPQGFYRH